MRKGRRMIPHTKEREVETNFVGEEHEFTIVANAKSFRLLSDKIYNDKIRAVIRELSTNAWDSHVMAGNTDTPFQVHLPTDMQPYFFVKDFGTGMTPEQVKTLYSTYFASNKTFSNLLNGAMGIGSKSVFAYTESVVVTSIVDGVKYTYTCFVTQQGKPVLKPMGEVETDEPNGFEVRLAVREGDIQEFSKAARFVFWSFDEEARPNVTGYHRYYEDVDYDKYILEKGDGWISVKDDTPYINGPSIRMGNVIYPLHIEKLRLFLTPGEQILLNFVIKKNMIFDMPLGSCDFAPSREELDYDEATQEALYNKLQEVRKVFFEEMDKAVAQSKSTWDAYFTRASLLKAFWGDADAAAVGDLLTDSSKMFDFSFISSNQTVDVRKAFEGREVHVIQAKDPYAARLTTKHTMYPSDKEIVAPISRSVHFAWVPEKKHITSAYHRTAILRWLVKHGYRSHLVYVIVGKPTKEELKKLGYPEFITRSDFPSREEISLGGSTTQKNMGFVMVKGEIEPILSEDDIPEEGVYIVMNRGVIRARNAIICSQQESKREYLRYLNVRLQNLPSNRIKNKLSTIVIIKTQHTKLLPSGMLPIVNVLKPFLDRSVQTLEDMKTRSRLFDTLSSKIQPIKKFYKHFWEEDSEELNPKEFQHTGIFWTSHQAFKSLSLSSWLPEENMSEDDRQLQEKIRDNANSIKRFAKDYGARTSVSTQDIQKSIEEKAEKILEESGIIPLAQIHERYPLVVLQTEHTALGWRSYEELDRYSLRDSGGYRRTEDVSYESSVKKHLIEYINMVDTINNFKGGNK
jgi:hypothetical protein